MKIYSKFKDYYDSASVYGIDETISYIRNQEEIYIKGLPSLYKFDIIGFCGEIYPFLSGMRVSTDSKINKEFTLYGDDAIKYKFNDRLYLHNYSENYLFHNVFELENDRNIRFNLKSPKENYNNLKNSLVLKEIFKTYKTPIFHLKGKRFGGDDFNLTINPNLGNYHFYKVKDSVIAFSEISQFLSNVLVSDTDVDVPVGGDEIVARSKGFNEDSFRKDPVKMNKIREKRKNII